MKIIELKAANVKRLKAVSITPEGSAVIIGGKNGQGKSSVLDSIMLALGGAKYTDTKPVRNGADRAEVTLDLGELVVRRTITAGGTANLVITNKEGSKYPTPQSIADGLFASLSFDPTAFLRMDSDKQAEVLKRLVGLDFNALDARRKLLFEERTVANRSLKQAQAALDATVIPANAPEAEVSVTELSQQLATAHSRNAVAAEARRKVDEIGKRGIALKDRVSELERELKAAHEALADLRLEYANAKDYAAQIPPVETAPLEAQLADAERLNTAYRQRQQAQRVAAQRDAAKAESDTLTAEIEKIDAEKQAALDAAQFPVAGLAVDENGVTFNGLPLEQASQAEKIRVSAAIVAGMNPKLKVLLCRDGALLDSDSRKALIDFVEERGYQLWLEVVGNDADCQFVIEDGAIKS